MYYYPSITLHGKRKHMIIVEIFFDQWWQNVLRARVYTPCACVRIQIIIWKLVNYLMSLSWKFCEDPSFRWGDIELLVTMYIWYYNYTLNYNKFLTENFNFLGHPFENVFTYSRHATFHWKNTKVFCQAQFQFQPSLTALILIISTSPPTLTHPPPPPG